MDNPLIEYSVIAVYLAVILSLGPACKKLTSGTDDYFRSGTRGTWWLVGMSSFMSGISALTFTGNGGAAYMAGWSVLPIYLGGAAAFLVHALYLGRKFRQLRVTTFPEAVRERFGPGTQQVLACFGIVLSTLTGGLWLLGLSIFAATTFSLPVTVMIPVLGFTVLFYSTVGGRWAVMATDFIQGLIMFVMTVLLTALCLVRFGGIGGFFAEIDAKGLGDSFKMIKPEGAFPNNDYALEWVLAMFFLQFIGMLSMTQSTRYFSVKDGKSATKAALLTMALMLFGTIIWFIPPMTARMLFSVEVMASGMPKPEESAFAVIAMNILPTGLIGMMVVAIFAATMSSLDTGLNGNVAILVRNIIPAVFRRLKKTLPDDKALLLASRIMTICFGLIIILIAYYLALGNKAGIFRFAIGLTATAALPLSIPMLLCLVVRNVPPWSCLFAVGCGLIPSLVYYLFPGLLSFGERALSVILVSAMAFLLTGFFPKTESYQRQVNAFFEKMHRPVDFEKEVGLANDHLQLLLIGRFALVIGFLLIGLLLIPNGWMDRLSIFAVGVAISSLGALFYFSGKIREQRNKEKLAAVEVENG